MLLIDNNQNNSSKFQQTKKRFKTQANLQLNESISFYFSLYMLFFHFIKRFFLKNLKAKRY
jgi:hypothetical protein